MRKFGTFLAAVWASTKETTTGATATLIGLVWQTAQWVNPKLIAPSFQPWMLWTPGIVLLFHAAFRAWRREHDRADRLEVDRAERAGPNVVFDRVVHSDITLDLPPPSHLRAPRRTEHLEVWEVWFRNRPTHPDQRSQAHNMTATVEFCDDQWRPRLEFVGQWVASSEPEHVGWTALHDQWDLPPTHTWAKLLLLGNDSAVLSSGKWSDMPNAEGGLEWIQESRRPVFALSGECIHAMAASTPPDKYWLSEDVCRLRVTLAALNMPERVYQFALTRDDQQAIIDISQI